jgi:hypothetical protein
MSNHEPVHPITQAYYTHRGEILDFMFQMPDHEYTYIGALELQEPINSTHLGEKVTYTHIEAVRVLFNEGLLIDKVPEDEEMDIELVPELNIKLLEDDTPSAVYGPKMHIGFGSIEFARSPFTKILGKTLPLDQLKVLIEPNFFYVSHGLGIPPDYITDKDVNYGQVYQKHILGAPASILGASAVAAFGSALQLLGSDRIKDLTTACDGY